MVSEVKTNSGIHAKGTKYHLQTLKLEVLQRTGLGEGVYGAELWSQISGLWHKKLSFSNMYWAKRHGAQVARSLKQTGCLNYLRPIAFQRETPPYEEIHCDKSLTYGND